MFISEVLRNDIDEYAARLRSCRLLEKARRGEVDPVMMGRYLASLHYLFSQTDAHLALAERESRARGQVALAHYFANKRREELGHEKWAENDITTVAAITHRPELPATVRPSAAVVELMAFVRDSLAREPLVYVAYIFFAEYLTVKLGPEWVAALEHKCGIPASAVTAASNHVELDKGHVDEGCRELDQLVVDESLHAPLRGMVSESMRYFSVFFDDVCDAAA
jgi:hypothetical protein